MTFLKKLFYAHIFAAILFGLGAFVVVIFLNHYEPLDGSDLSTITQHDDHAQREKTIEWLQAYSDYIGFKGVFSIDSRDELKLRMTKSELCSNDFFDTVPKDMKSMALIAGFKSFECSYQNYYTIMQLHE